MQAARKKVKSTPFSDFVRNASSQEKKKFFEKIIKESVAEQRALVQQAEAAGKI